MKSFAFLRQVLWKCGMGKQQTLPVANGVRDLISPEPAELDLHYPKVKVHG